MSNQEKTLFVELRRSKYVLTYLAVIHCLLVSMLFMLLSIQLALLLAVLLAVHLYVLCYQSQRLSAKQVISAITLTTKGVATFHSQERELLGHYRLSSCYRCSLFVIITVKRNHFFRRKALFIAIDSVELNQFRQLQLFLAEPKLYRQ